MIRLLPIQYGNISTYIISLIKAYIIFGGALGGSLGILRIIKESDVGFFFQDILFKGFFPAIIFIIVVGLIDVILKAIIFYKYRAIPFNIRQVREFIISGNHEIVCRKMEILLKDIANVDVYLNDCTNGLIKAMVKRSWKSFGEIITVEIQGIKKNESKVSLSSEPRFKYSFLDYNKNFENVEMIMAFLKGSLGMPLTF